MYPRGTGGLASTMRFPEYGREPGWQFHRVAAAIARGKHPVPSRTRKLSPSAPMVLRGRPRGRVGHRRTYHPKKAGPLRGPASLRCAHSAAIPASHTPISAPAHPISRAPHLPRTPSPGHLSFFQRLQVKGSRSRPGRGALGPEPNFSRRSSGRSRGNSPAGPPLRHQSQKFRRSMALRSVQSPFWKFSDTDTAPKLTRKPMAGATRKHREPARPVTDPALLLSP